MKKLSVLVFNTCYSTNAKNLVGFLRTHADHYLNRHDKIEKYADLDRTLDVVKNKQPEILLLMEVLGGTQTDYLADKLRKNGYKSVHVGKGHGYGNAGKNVQLILATKQENETQDNIEFDVPKRPGNGGGMVSTVIKPLDCLVIGVHWPRKGLDTAKRKYLEVLKKIIRKNKCKRVILMGDLNMTPEKWRKNYSDLLPGFSLLSADSPTCSATFLFRNFYSKCLDLIYGKGFTTNKKEIIETYSDHKAVYVELE
ncbi:MAG: hypothetical protein US89_C0006G0073 [Candidatus Peregrinibacteria bacterium GW2011_GWF2_38_29]|nr:MAG: hypothetical protein US89_C0006G0073 [Candidatus Peregrinibacteria bacterium GW2011_GWF2_38_29]HBB03264.1 hypothetical protein [Candidatus Peregrinibacteria bacterium]